MLANPNAVSVELMDSNDEFHRALNVINWAKGKGDIVAVVTAPTPADFSHISGMAIRCLQYGMSSFRFTVILDKDGYELRALGQRKSMRSDYFKE